MCTLSFLPAVALLPALAAISTYSSRYFYTLIFFVYLADIPVRQYLTSKGYIATSQYLITAQAGTEPTTGSATLTTQVTSAFISECDSYAILLRCTALRTVWSSLKVVSECIVLSVEEAEGLSYTNRSCKQEKIRKMLQYCVSDS